MATIEERAHQYGCKIAGGHYSGGLRGMMYESNRDAYIEIATEQMEIDIEKACAWLENALNGDNIEGCRDGKKLINEFKKEMEALG